MFYLRIRSDIPVVFTFRLGQFIVSTLPPMSSAEKHVVLNGFKVSEHSNEQNGEGLSIVVFVNISKATPKRMTLFAHCLSIRLYICLSQAIHHHVIQTAKLI